MWRKCKHVIGLLKELGPRAKLILWESDMSYCSLLFSCQWHSRLWKSTLATDIMRSLHWWRTEVFEVNWESVIEESLTDTENELTKTQRNKKQQVWQTVLNLQWSHFPLDKIPCRQMLMTNRARWGPHQRKGVEHNLITNRLEGRGEFY